MMVARSALPVNGLSIRIDERVDLPSCRQVLQLAIDRRQPYPVARATQLLMELLCAPEGPGIVKRVLDRGPLPGHSTLTGSFAHSTTRRATIVATPATSAITCTTDLAGSGSL